MASVVEIKDMGTIKIIHGEKEIELPAELVLFAADEYREKAKEPKKKYFKCLTCRGGQYSCICDRDG
jgi:hypothetical protein